MVFKYCFAQTTVIYDKGVEIPAKLEIDASKLHLIQSQSWKYNLPQGVKIKKDNFDSFCMIGRGKSEEAPLQLEAGSAAAAPAAKAEDKKKPAAKKNKLKSELLFQKAPQKGAFSFPWGISGYVLYMVYSQLFELVETSLDSCHQDKPVQNPKRSRQARPTT